jgi:hypothetical protein
MQFNSILTIAPYLVLGLVITGFIAFLIFFLAPALRVSSMLKMIVNGISSLKEKVSQPSLVKATDVGQLMIAEPYKHLWAEYSDTLHISFPLVFKVSCNFSTGGLYESETEVVSRTAESAQPCSQDG